MVDKLKSFESQEKNDILAMPLFYIKIFTNYHYFVAHKPTNQNGPLSGETSSRIIFHSFGPILNCHLRKQINDNITIFVNKAANFRSSSINEAYFKSYSIQLQSALRKITNNIVQP